MIHPVRHGQRRKEEGQIFVQKIKPNRDGEAPLFLSDGWPSYLDVLAHAYSHEEPVEYSGRGRPQNPIRVIDVDLKYAQVIKRKKMGAWLRVKRENTEGYPEHFYGNVAVGLDVRNLSSPVTVPSAVVDCTATFVLERDPFSPPQAWVSRVMIELALFPAAGRVQLGHDESREVMFRIRSVSRPNMSSRPAS